VALRSFRLRTCFFRKGRGRGGTSGTSRSACSLGVRHFFSSRLWPLVLLPSLGPIHPRSGVRDTGRILVLRTGSEGGKLLGALEACCWGELSSAWLGASLVSVPSLISDGIRIKIALFPGLPGLTMGSRSGLWPFLIYISHYFLSLCIHFHDFPPKQPRQSKMSGEGSYFPSPPAAYSLEAFDRLPNHGTYCLKYVPEKPVHRLPVSSLWKLGQRTRLQKRKTLDFLRETQMYIENIRKPQVVKFREKVLTPRIVPKPKKTGEIVQSVVIPPCGPTYSLKYIGDLDGKITITTTRCPFQCRSKAPPRSAWSERRGQTQDWTDGLKSMEATRLPSRGDDLRGTWAKSTGKWEELGREKAAFGRKSAYLSG